MALSWVVRMNNGYELLVEPDGIYTEADMQKIALQALTDGLTGTIRAWQKEELYTNLRPEQWVAIPAESILFIAVYRNTSAPVTGP